MSMAASSTSSQHGSTPAPPPPTPSNQSTSKSFSSDADMELSQFLNKLLLNQTAPSLSSPPPRSAKRLPTPSPQPLISLTDPLPDLLLSAASETGFFHLAGHGIPSDLHDRAVEESRSLNTANVRSSLGFNQADDDDDDEEEDCPVFDTCSSELESFPETRELAKSMERLGLQVVDLILEAAGFENPFETGSIRPRCLMWVSSSCASPRADVPVIKEEEEEEEEGEEVKKGKCFPYVVCLQYEMKEVRWVMGDSGVWTAVDPSPDSVLVALGDIAQVWSNGRFKKVRGIPQCNSPEQDCDDSERTTLSLLVTLPMDSLVSPLPSKSWNTEKAINGGDDEDGGSSEHVEGGERLRFHEFSFEEYAWRVFHDRFPFKDPLLRYQT